MTAATRAPIGLHLARTAKAVSEAFDAVLTQEGGSLSTWVVLLTLKTRQSTSQRDLAAAVGIRGATLTHHLNAMEGDGLLTRRRDPRNRRVHRVELTRRGEEFFLRLREAASAFDRRLRAQTTADELETLRGLLDRLRANVRGAAT